MTGWPPGLLQDDCRKLSKWLAGKPDARYIARKNIDMTNKNDPHAELMALADTYAIEDGLCLGSSKAEDARDALEAYARTLTDRLERAERMFGAACADLGAINEALGLDPDDGGAEPIIDAIKEMQSCVGAGGVGAMMPAARPLDVAASVTDAPFDSETDAQGSPTNGQTLIERLNTHAAYSSHYQDRTTAELCLLAAHALAASRAPVALPAESTDHDQLDAMALDRYKVVATTGGFWPFAVVAGDGTAYLYIGQRKTCEQVARRLAGAFLDGAFTATHPQKDAK